MKGEPRTKPGERWHPKHPDPTDPEHFMGVDGAAPCVHCGRWTGLRNLEGEARCSQCQGRHP